MDQSGWCPDHAICMEWIERRAVELIENFIEADSVYMSNDVYAQFISTMAKQRLGFSSYDHKSSSAGFNIIRIITSVGELTVKRVAILNNFCYVGASSSAERLIQEKISQEFEKAFF